MKHAWFYFSQCNGNSANDIVTLVKTTICLVRNNNNNTQTQMQGIVYVVF